MIKAHMEKIKEKIIKLQKEEEEEEEEKQVALAKIEEERQKAAKIKTCKGGGGEKDCGGYETMGKGKSYSNN